MPNDLSATGQKQPQTRAEWQAAVDVALGAQYLHSARAYGLVTGGPDVNVERCTEFLRLGKARGITPAPDAIERFMNELHEDGKA